MPLLALSFEGAKAIPFYGDTKKKRNAFVDAVTDKVSAGEFRTLGIDGRAINGSEYDTTQSETLFWLQTEASEAKFNIHSENWPETIIIYLELIRNAVNVVEIANEYAEKDEDLPKKKVKYIHLQVFPNPEELEKYARKSK